MPARILVIGLDACEPSLLRRWADAGHLPTFRALREGSLEAALVSSVGLYAGSAWPSFSTAVSPAKHRRFFRRQTPRGGYIDSDFSPHQLAAPAFWDALAEAGQKVAVIDVPHSKPSPGIGLQLVDWSSHEPEIAPCWSNPPGLSAEMSAQFGQPVPDHCDSAEVTPEGIRSFVRRLEERARNKTEISLHCLDQAKWDFFLTVFSEAHCIGHQTWHIHDPSHPRHHRGFAQAVGDPMLTVYQALDNAVARLLAAVDHRTAILLVTVHGMGASSDESVILDEVLRRLEKRTGGTVGGVYGHLKRAWYAMPAAIRGASAMRRLRSFLAPSLHEAMLVPERKSRHHFQIPNNPHAGAIRINLAGREAAGTVKPGEYRALCEHLASELMQLRDAATGTPVVQEVVLVRDVYEGPFVDELPDLLVEWSRSATVSAITAPGIGTIEIPMTGGRSGDHHGEGLVLLRAPGLAGGRLDRPLSVQDVGPTVAARLGVGLPHVDGRVAPALLAGLGGAANAGVSGLAETSARYASR